MRDDDQPAPGAVPLSEALNPQLVEVARRASERLTTARAAVPPQPSWIDGARLDVEAWEHSPAVRAEAAAQGEANHAWRAAADDRRARLISGEWLAWGREDNPWGRWRAISPDAWNTLVVINEENGIVRVAAPSEARLYSVVVRKTHYEVRSVPAATANGTTTTPVTGKARKRRGPKPEIKTAIQAVFCQWAEDGESFALVVGMSEHKRRTAVGKALGLTEDEYPSRSYVQEVWKESLPELKLRQKSGKLRQIPAT